MRVVLRLKVEEKYHTNTYRPETQQMIVETVLLAIERFNIIDTFFEMIVLTEDNYVTKCVLKMSEDIYEYFVESYGGKKYLEKDYQVIFLKTA